MSYLPGLMVGVALAVVGFEAHGDEVADATPLASGLIQARCLDPKSEQLGRASMEDYWAAVEGQYGSLMKAEDAAKRNAFQRYVLDRVTFRAGYGSDYNIALANEDRTITTTDGGSASINYEVPLGALFSTKDQRGAPEALKAAERKIALDKGRSDFMGLAYEYKLAVAKAVEEKDANKVSAVVAAERLAMRMAALSTKFEQDCLR